MNALRSDSLHSRRPLVVCVAAIVVVATLSGRCTQAHPIRAQDGLHPLGPPLTALGSKLADPNWIVAWLLHPAQLHRNQSMRPLRVTVEEAHALADFLFQNTQ
ncbi:MAG: hypothetical protein HY270_24800, partial [Deltaproteobacteria bacterium]|nr:hypothetical protein [Deltaproteobacteria bacterium]